jgi:hypothetical protein
MPMFIVDDIVMFRARMEMYRMAILEEARSREASNLHPLRNINAADVCE